MSNIVYIYTELDSNNTLVKYLVMDDNSVITVGGVNNQAILGTSGDDVINGSGSNVIFGLGGNDTIYGGNGNSILDGGPGVDTVIGGTGNDTLIYNIAENATNTASDVYDGGAGNNTLVIDMNQAVIPVGLTAQQYADAITNYFNANSSGTVDFSQLTYNNTNIGFMLTAQNIENISIINNDNIITGTSGDDVITGGPGNDTIVGSAGNDTIDGGSGVNTIDYSNSNTNYVNLNSQDVDENYGVAYKVTGEVDELSNIQNVIGSPYDEYIFGNTGDNILRGNGGNDVLYSFGGNDVLDGGSGIDIASYAEGQIGGVNVNLNSGIAHDSLGGTDTLISIENVIGSGFDDVLIGDSGDNVITGLAGNDYIDGGGGSNTASYQDVYSDMGLPQQTGVVANLSTGIASDGYGTTDTLVNIQNLIGSNFDDTLIGNDGDNVLTGMGGNDILIGGGGVDTAVYNTFLGNQSITADDVTGSVYVYSAEGSDTLSQIEKIQFTDTVMNVFTGTSANDSLVGTAGPDMLIGLDGNDTLSGGAGNDYLYGGAGNDYLDGGAGNDILKGGAGNDTLVGGAGTDTAVYSNNVANYNISVDDNGVITVSSVAEGTDTLSQIEAIQFYNAWVNVYTGSSANDTLTGTDWYSDILIGLGGNDTLNGGGGNDWLFGGAGDDVLIGGSGNDYLDGGTGTNTANYAVSNGPVNVNLSLGTAADGFGGTDTLVIIQNVVGSNYNDILTGNNNNNVISGGAGNDTINGLGGNDTLTGGTGNDTFVFAPGSSADTITDFHPNTGGQADLINFHAFTIQGANASAKFQTLVNNATVDKSGNVVLHPDPVGNPGDSIDLIGIHSMTALHATDFIF